MVQKGPKNSPIVQGFNGPVHVYPMPFLTGHSYIYSA